MRLYQDKNESGVFFAYERFEDQNAVDYHGAQGYTHALLQVLPEISQSAPEVMLLENTAPAPLHESNPKAINPEDDVFILFSKLDNTNLLLKTNIIKDDISLESEILSLKAMMQAAPA